MKIVKEELYALLEKALLKAKDKKKKVLCSYVREIKANNPITFFAQGIAFKGTRFFWSNPTRNHYLVGLGYAHEIGNNFSQQRFWAVQDEWSKLTENIVSNIELGENMGTGPLLFGGFSFDPDKERTSLWRNYQEAKMVVPSFLLTRIEGRNYLTINQLVAANDNLENILNDLVKKEETIFKTEDRKEPQENSILKQRDVNMDEWLDSVAGIVGEIKQGNVKKVVLARELRLKMKEKVDVAIILARLLEDQPKSYVFALESKNDCFVGASPELLVKKEKNQVDSMCLAGTTSRGANFAEDEKLGNDLLNDQKNLYEHALVVEMIKDVMEKHCTDIEISKWPTLYDLKNVKHLYTPVKALCQEGVSLLDIVEDLHPTPALGGYPKDASMAIIRTSEVLDRGWYASPIGWMDSKLDGEFSVAIRSALIQGSKATLFAGGGIVKGSKPALEYHETTIKFEAMLSAFRG